MLHIDYIDGTTPKTDLYGIGDIDSDMALDIHMITTEIKESDIDFFNQVNAKYVCYQYENLSDKNINSLYAFKGKVGLSFTMETPWQDLINVIENERIDFILIMCTIPGISGQSFNYDNLDRIKAIKCKYPNLELHVDGGVDNRLSTILDKLHVSLIVSGSFLANATDDELMARICQLKYSNHETIVSDVMIPIEYIQTVNLSDKFIDIVGALDNDKMSTIIVSNGKKFIGVITDGDIRRNILLKKEKCFQLIARELVNRNAYYVPPDYKVSNLMFDLAISNRTILAVPVVDNEEVIGIVNAEKLSM